MSLSDFSWTADTMTSFASGYRSTPSAITIAGAAVFKYVSSEISTAVYVYIPVTTAGAATNADVVDLTSAKGPSPSLASFDGNGPLSSSFSFLNLNNYNQWYIQSASTKTVLVSRYVYKVTGVANLQTTASGAASELLASDFSATTAASTGDKLCYASASNVPTRLSSSGPASAPSSPSGSSGSQSSSTGSSTSSRTQSPRAASTPTTSPKTSGPAGRCTRSRRWHMSSFSRSCRG